MSITNIPSPCASRACRTISEVVFEDATTNQILSQVSHDLIVTTVRLDEVSFSITAKVVLPDDAEIGDTVTIYNGGLASAPGEGSTTFKVIPASGDVIRNYSEVQMPANVLVLTKTADGFWYF